MTKIFIGSDHAGFKLKQAILKASLIPQALTDCGTNSGESTDYPIYAQSVCTEVLKNSDSLGVLICGSGIGMSIAANRYKGIRAALCHTEKDASLSRQHNNANILVLAANTTNEAQALKMIENFIQTPFEGGRHLRRIQQIDN